MVAIELQVSRLSKQILLAQYNGDVVITGNDPNLYRLRYTNTKRGGGLYLQRKRLNDTLTIKVPDEVAKQLKTHGTFAAMCLHNIHIHEINTYIWHEVQHKVPAKDALKTFRENHNIEEDDFCLESAYKSWIRFSKKKKDEIAKKPEQGRTIFVRGETEQFSVIIPEDERVLLSMAEEEFNISIEALKSPSKKAQLSSVRKALYYMLYTHCGMSYRKIARMFNRQSPSGVHDAVKEISFLLHHHPGTVPKVQKLLSLVAS